MTSDDTGPGAGHPTRTTPEAALLHALDVRRKAWSAGPQGSGRDLGEVQRGLTDFLATLGTGLFEITQLRRLAGGGTNNLFGFRLQDTTGDRPLVLRIKSPGASVVTSMQREFQMMRAAGQVIPVPQALHAIEDVRHFGAEALICEFMPGVQRAAESDQAMSGMGIAYPEPLREHIGLQFVQYLARLHATPCRPEALGAFELPRTGTLEAIDRRLAFWDHMWDEDKLADHPVLTLTREWLWAHRPVTDVVSLLHGDYRNGNFLFDPQTGDITAILDWEMCAVGDRHADLAYTMFRSFGRPDPAGRFLVGGLLPTAEFTRLYEATAGLQIDRARLRYYGVFNMYWSTIAMLASALSAAHAGMSQLDVMYNMMAGKGVLSCRALLDIVTKDAP